MADVVVVSLEAWDTVWRRNQYLVDGLMRREEKARVLFVEPPADPLHAALERSRPRWGRGLRRIPSAEHGGRLWALQQTKVLPRKVDRRVDARLAAGVVRAASRLGMTDPLLWVNAPSGADVLEMTGWRSLYDVTDDWLLAERPPAELARLRRQESYLLEHADEVVVCSPALKQTKGATRPVTLVPNAVDEARYQRPAPRPDDLPELPCVVYIGTAHRDRLDVELCIQLGESLGSCARLVLVGPIALVAADRTAMEQAGVLLLGPRDRDAIPGYLQHAHVLVVPHVVSPFTESLDPIKAYEYRAVGRPVVSTPVAGFREQAAERWLVRAGLDFIQAVHDLLGQDSPFPVGVTAGGDSWERRAAQMQEVLRRVESSPRTRPATGS